MTATPRHATGNGTVSANGVSAGETIADVRHDVESLVNRGELGTVLRDFVNEAPGLSIGTAALLGYVLGAGVPPVLMSLAASAAARMAFTALLQQQLFTTRRNP